MDLSPVLFGNITTVRIWKNGDLVYRPKFIFKLPDIEPVFDWTNRGAWMKAVTSCAK